MKTRLGLFRFDPAGALVCFAVLAALTVCVGCGDQVGMRTVVLEPNATGVPASTHSQVQIRFDQPLAPATPVTLTFSPPVSGQVTITGDTLRFTPGEPLQTETQYRVRLEPGVTGAQGRSLLQPVEWTFQTAAPQLLFLGLDDHGQLQLFESPLRAGASHPRQLTDIPLGVSAFDVAPDGQTLVYAATGTDGSVDLWRLALASGEPELLLACPNAICTDPVWSPSGNLLALSVRMGDATTLPMAAEPHLWLLDMETGENTLIFPSEEAFSYGASWSADGQWLAYNTLDQVGVYNREDERAARFVSPTRSGGVWHPQRNEFVLTREWPAQHIVETHIFLADPLKGDKLDLSANDLLVTDSAPAWSPDGEWLAFRRGVLSEENLAPKAQIWRMRGDGSDQEPLTEDAEFDHGPPVWSGDGRYLAYTRAAQAGDLATSIIWARDMATGEAWQVAAGQAPAWVP